MSLRARVHEVGYTVRRVELAVPEERVVDPAGGFVGPAVGFARGALGGVGWVVGGVVGEGDELDVGAVGEGLGGGRGELSVSVR